MSLFLENDIKTLTLFYEKKKSQQKENIMCIYVIFVSCIMNFFFFGKVTVLCHNCVSEKKNIEVRFSAKDETDPAGR